MHTAGIGPELRGKAMQILAGSRKPGRKPEPDDDLVVQLAGALTPERKPYAAATLVTKNMPEPQRKQTRNRIYKKYMAAPAVWQEKARLARLTEEERRAEIRREVEEMKRKLRDLGRP